MSSCYIDVNPMELGSFVMIKKERKKEKYIEMPICGQVGIKDSDT